MYSEEGGTYLEDFLSAIEFVPTDVRRNFELVRELDKEVTNLRAELRVLQSKYIENIDSTSQQKLDEIYALRDRIKERLTHKIVIVQNMTGEIDSIVRKLDSDLAFFETELRGCGEFDSAKGIPPGTEVAIKIFSEDDITSPTSSSTIILGRVIFYHPDVAQYDVADVDDSKRYSVHESDVFQLNMAEAQKKLSKGNLIYAIYPDTTSFYPATVSQLPRRNAMNAEPTVLVQFQGDADEYGVTPFRAVSLKYVFRSNS